MEQLWNDMRTTVCETLGIEQAPVTVNPEEDEVDSRVQSLSEELDIDALNDDFKKFAGVDGMLSRAEFNTFIKMKQIPSAVAGVLWSLLDRDNSGEVSKDEFKSALLALRNSQSWSRYCPACEYRNECAFCQECNSGCPRCSDNSFCASCWNDHPGRQQTMEEQALLALHPLQPTVPNASSMPATPTALTTPTDPRQPRHLCHLRHHMHPLPGAGQPGPRAAPLWLDRVPARERPHPTSRVGVQLESAKRCAPEGPHRAANSPADSHARNHLANWPRQVYPCNTKPGCGRCLPTKSRKPTPLPRRPRPLPPPTDFSIDAFSFINYNAVSNPRDHEKKNKLGACDETLFFLVSQKTSR